MNPQDHQDGAKPSGADQSLSPLAGLKNAQGVRLSHGLATLVVPHTFWASRVPCFRGSSEATWPVQCHRESMRFFHWRACFRGVAPGSRCSAGAPKAWHPTHFAKPFFSVFFVLFAVSPCFAGPRGDPTYWNDVRPILRKNCTVCHGARNLKEIDVSGGLALDSYEAVLKGGKRSVIQVGKSDGSQLVRLIRTSDDEKRMPLAATPLSAENIATIRRWIDTGAKRERRERGRRAGLRSDDNAS